MYIEDEKGFEEEKQMAKEEAGWAELEKLKPSSKIGKEISLFILSLKK